MRSILMSFLMSSLAPLAACQSEHDGDTLRLGDEVVGQLAPTDTVGVSKGMRLQYAHLEVTQTGAAVLAESRLFNALVGVIPLHPDGSVTDRIAANTASGDDPACVIVPPRRAGRYRILAGGEADHIVDGEPLPTGPFVVRVVALSDAPTRTCVTVPDRSEREILDEHYRELRTP